MKDTKNVNQALPTMTAFYILTQPNPVVIDEHWTGDCGRLLDWVRHKFGRGPYFRTGPSTSRARRQNIRVAVRGPDWQATPRAGAHQCDVLKRTRRFAGPRRRLPGGFNYATYFADNDGRIVCCGLDYAESYWFDDGYGDHVRHYLWAMGAVPEFAPIGENHLLRSTSVVTHVAYASDKIEYRSVRCGCDGSAFD